MHISQVISCLKIWILMYKHVSDHVHDSKLGREQL
jgi:hypothetical protein